MAGELPSTRGALETPRYSAVGWASWYGSELHGRRTADGETFDMRGLTAAHKTMPIPCYARVTNLSNGRSVVVRVNDRGPYVGGRLVDVSARVASLLDFRRLGVTKVKVDYVGKAPPAAANAAEPLASLRTGASALSPDSVIDFVSAAPPDDSFARVSVFAAASRAANEPDRLADAELRSPQGELPASPYGSLEDSPFLVVTTRH
jgi:rare lipoprotein A (peptidoglycan hydrolase)